MNRKRSNLLATTISVLGTASAGILFVLPGFAQSQPNSRPSIFNEASVPSMGTATVAQNTPATGSSDATTTGGASNIRVRTNDSTTQPSDGSRSSGDSNTGAQTGGTMTQPGSTPAGATTGGESNIRVRTNDSTTQQPSDGSRSSGDSNTQTGGTMAPGGAMTPGGTSNGATTGGESNIRVRTNDSTTQQQPSDGSRSSGDSNTQTGGTSEGTTTGGASNQRIRSNSTTIQQRSTTQQRTQTPAGTTTGAEQSTDGSSTTTEQPAGPGSVRALW